MSKVMADVRKHAKNENLQRMEKMEEGFNTWRIKRGPDRRRCEQRVPRNRK